MRTQELTKSELEVYNFCIKMGDTVEQAIEGVLIERKRQESYKEYYNAYNN